MEENCIKNKEKSILEFLINWNCIQSITCKSPFSNILRERFYQFTWFSVGIHFPSPNNFVLSLLCSHAKNFPSPDIFLLFFFLRTKYQSKNMSFDYPESGAETPKSRHRAVHQKESYHSCPKSISIIQIGKH